jgi:hypothetical protein
VGTGALVLESRQLELHTDPIDGPWRSLSHPSEPPRDLRAVPVFRHVAQLAGDGIVLRRRRNGGMSQATAALGGNGSAHTAASAPALQRSLGDGSGSAFGLTARNPISKVRGHCVHSNTGRSAGVCLR